MTGLVLKFLVVYYTVVSLLQKEEDFERDYKDAFLQTYAYLKSRDINNIDSQTRFGLLYFSYMPYPEVKRQLPIITDYNLNELEEFIFGAMQD